MKVIRSGLNAENPILEKPHLFCELEDKRRPGDGRLVAPLQLGGGGGGGAGAGLSLTLHAREQMCKWPG